MRRGQIKYLKLEDLENIYNSTIKIYNTHKNDEKKVQISQKLNEEIKKNEKELKNRNKYFRKLMQHQKQYLFHKIFYAWSMKNQVQGNLKLNL